MVKLHPSALRPEGDREGGPDGKSRLLEWGQKRRKKVEFVIREEGGGTRGKVYVAEVHINGEVKGTGRGIEQEDGRTGCRPKRLPLHALAQTRSTPRTGRERGR